MTAATDGIARFAARFPVVWHVVEADGVAGVASHGLLPAADLLRRAGAPPTDPNRDDFRRVQLGDDGSSAVLRFQLMADAKITPSLHGAFAGQPALWRALIDSQVFFWADPARRDSFLRACHRTRRRSQAAPLGEPPVTLAFDTAALLGAEAPAFYSTFNTGSTVRGAARARRDEDTFRPVGAYRSGPAAELAIRGPVPAALLARARLP
ncbi:MAG TPA: hypothetical protein VGC15_09360 [Acetobacteraceae bacterium]